MLKELRECLENRILTVFWTYIDVDGGKIQLPTNLYYAVSNIINGGMAAGGGSSVLLLLHGYCTYEGIEGRYRASSATRDDYYERTTAKIPH